MSDDKLPNSVLFVCSLNSIRSPIAEGIMKAKFGDDVYVQSCGLGTGELNELMVAIMREKGIDMSAHISKTLNEIGDSSFDIAIAFSEDVGAAVKSYFDDSDTVVEIWVTPDPTAGAQDVRAMMDNYRSVRSHIEGKIRIKFG
ncbi:MAG: low molecular weight phosphatase family protein [Robiginitomaculum sp.]